MVDGDRTHASIVNLPAAIVVGRVIDPAVGRLLLEEDQDIPESPSIRPVW